jgi:hypothetical protein
MEMLVAVPFDAGKTEISANDQDADQENIPHPRHVQLARFFMF